MKKLFLQFTEPYKVSVLEEDVPLPSGREVLVRTICSAISPGTELLVYRGQWPENVAVDETIEALAGKFRYPLKYGYSAVGQVEAVGSDVSRDWLGRRVFAFNPHESHFVSAPEHLVPLPASLSPEEAAFLPNMETAVGFVLDGNPMIGEQVAVFGQGIVGLLTTALLTRFPLGHLATFDAYGLRRDKSAELGAHQVLDPSAPDVMERLLQNLQEKEPRGVDLAYEVSGNPAALEQAINATAFSGRIVVGSWYGGKRANLDLGGHFHRSRIQIISSQVSRLSPTLTGLWTKARRMRLAMIMLEQVRPSRLITCRYHISKAAEAYALLDEHPEQAIQIMFEYKDL
jgi:2-desacetyl-2-hydroxyethyl bacteriochlorophyllide A dehydrogenase